MPLACRYQWPPPTPAHLQGRRRVLRDRDLEGGDVVDEEDAREYVLPHAVHNRGTVLARDRVLVRLHRGSGAPRLVHGGNDLDEVHEDAGALARCACGAVQWVFGPRKRLPKGERVQRVRDVELGHCKGVELVDVAGSARVRLAHRDVEVALDLVDEHVACEAAALAVLDPGCGAPVLPLALLGLRRYVTQRPALVAVAAEEVLQAGYMQRPVCVTPYVSGSRTQAALTQLALHRTYCSTENPRGSGRRSTAHSSPAGVAGQERPPRLHPNCTGKEGKIR